MGGGGGGVGGAGIGSEGGAWGVRVDVNEELDFFVKIGVRPRGGGLI